MKRKTIIEWEVGDTVEEIATGHKGIVTGHIGNMPNVRHTSPCEFDKCAYDADDLRPWQPGYGYMPTGERVPEKDGWEMVPEDDLHNIDGAISIHWHDWRVSQSNCYFMEVVAKHVKTGTIRAVYRRKQPAEVPAPEPKMVPFDGPEDLPEWPVIWVRYPDGRIRMSMDHNCDGLRGNYPVLWFAPWNSLFNGFQISPDRRNWQVAGKQI